MLLQMAKRKLSERVAELTRALPSVHPKLQTAFDDLTTDPQKSLIESRLLLDKIVNEIARYEDVQLLGCPTIYYARIGTGIDYEIPS